MNDEPRFLAAHSAPESGRTVIQARDLGVRYGGHTVWSDATFNIGAGEFVAILGPNGAGKSTLLQLLLGLQQPTSGTLEVLGQPPRRGNPAIGYVPQSSSMDAELAVSGRYLVSLGVDGHHWGFRVPGTTGRRRRTEVAQVLDRVEAASYADRPIGQLSGGERQRLLLAQALISEPQLLLFDEPLASLDLRHQTGLAHLIAELARQQGATVLMVTHDVNPVLAVTDRILYIANGRVATGDPKEIITSECLTELYGAPVEVLHDSRGRVVVVGAEAEDCGPCSAHYGPEPQVARR